MNRTKRGLGDYSRYDARFFSSEPIYQLTRATREFNDRAYLYKPDLSKLLGIKQDKISQFFLVRRAWHPKEGFRFTYYSLMRFLNNPKDRTRKIAENIVQTIQGETKDRVTNRTTWRYFI